MTRLLWVLSLAAAAQSFPLGKIIDDVAITKDSAQRYGLYLPSNYSHDRQWPLILAFDPGGRGRLALDQYQVAAEKFGYVVAASNVSRNGPWSISTAAAQAMGEDVTARFRIDERRIYTAGMSGGARVALGVTLGSPNLIAGVIASSAGYPDSTPRKRLPFVLFGTAGSDDFNWLEMRALDRELTTPHRLAVFDGGHVWLSSELAVEALEWLDFQAMFSGRLQRDEARIKSICAKLHDAPCDPPPAAYAKAIKAAQKEIRAEELKERLLLDEIIALEQQLNSPGQRSEAYAKLADQWTRLTKAAAADDSPNRRIARRVSRALSMSPGERAKDAEYVKLVTTHRPEREGPR